MDQLHDRRPARSEMDGVVEIENQPRVTPGKKGDEMGQLTPDNDGVVFAGTDEVAE